MSRTRVHSPFRTTAYNRLTDEVIPHDGRLYHNVCSIDFTEFNPDWHEAVRHFARPRYESTVKRSQNRQRRNHDRNVMRRITADPDFYDDADFADHRADSYAWS